MKNTFRVIINLIFISALIVPAIQQDIQNDFEAEDTCFPRQVRLLIGEKYSDSSSPYTATIMYQTYDECLDSGIILSLEELKTSKKSTVHSLWDDTFCHNKKKNCEEVHYDQYIHTIKVAAVPSKLFSYYLCSSVKDIAGCTQEYSSTMPPLKDTKKNSNNTGIKILFFGDHDLSKPGVETFVALAKTFEQESFDAFLFLGDYGYEFYQNNGQVGDDYLEALSLVTAAAPMAITAGNHEDNYNFEFFNQKFQMPNFHNTKNNYYSFDLDNVHFISLNLHYFNNQVTDPNLKDQQAMLEWVEKDLSSVDRSKTPWVIASGHKMIYCKGSDCEEFADDYAPFDELFNKYNVDLFISGHKHKFQVMKPIIDKKVAKFDISDDNVISNYEGFPTVVQGNGGTSKNDESLVNDSFIREKLSIFKNDAPFSTAEQKKAMLYEITNIGFGKLTIQSDEQLLIESVDSSSNEIIYSFGLNRKSRTQSKIYSEI